LLQLGGGEVGQALPPVFVWWRGFASRYVTALCQHSVGMDVAAAAPARATEVPPPDEGELVSLVLTAPMMAGAEYLTPDVLRAQWAEMGRAVAACLAIAGTDLQSFLKEMNPAWNLVGRVHFNLAENRRDQEAPFAFMATYTRQLSAQARAQHVPLGQALREYADAAGRSKLLSLLLPVQRAAERCAWLRPMVDTGEIFHPLRWSPQEAWQFLESAADLTSAGVVVRMPVGWRASRPPRPRVTATVGPNAPSKLGLEALLDFAVEMTLDGEPLREQEIRALLSGTDGWCCCAANGSRLTGHGLNGHCGSFRPRRNWRARRGCRSPRRCGCWPVLPSHARSSMSKRPHGRAGPRAHGWQAH